MFSRKVISYHVSNRIDTKLVIDTFNKAYLSRNKPTNVLFHSNRGSQYISKDFRKVLDDVGFIQSFSKKGHPYDNAVFESFFKSFKHEEANRRTYRCLDHLKLSVFQYIEGFYNSNRLYYSIGLLTPNQFELNFFLKR